MLKAIRKRLILVYIPSHPSALHAVARVPLPPRICSQPMPSIDLAADTPNSAPKQRLKARGKEQMWDARPYAQKQER